MLPPCLPAGIEYLWRFQERMDRMVMSMIMKPMAGEMPEKIWIEPGKCGQDRICPQKWPFIECGWESWKS